MVDKGENKNSGYDTFFQNVKNCLSSGDIRQAKQLLQELLSREPGNAHASFLLGTIAGQHGDYSLAERLIAQAIHKKPDEPVYYNHYGNALLLSGQYTAAAGAYQNAIHLKPDYADAYNNLGNVYYELGNYPKAISSYKSAIAISPENPEAYYHLGNASYKFGNNNYASFCYQKALSINPHDARVHYNLGNLLKEQGNNADALESYRKAIELAPEYQEAHWAFAVSQIPIMTGSKEDVYKCRLDFLRELKNLSNWLITNKCTSAHLAVGSHTPFYLAYHEENNRELLARYGELCVRIMKHGSDIQQYLVRKEKNRSIIKIGIVSAHIYDHSVWNALVKSWVKYLDKKRFEIHLFYLGSKNDHETEWARQKSESFQQDYTNVDQWVSAITEKKCDVLIYPEIGMNAMTIKLASLRLAGVQMTSWGHPETTGLPTMDYYLSAKCLEPRDAQDNYTETLVTLPNLGCCYRPIQIEVTVPDFRMLGIEPDRPILVCAGAPFKYNPQHDAVFTGIARQIEKCTFIFFEYRIPELSSILFRRLKHVFLSENLDINRYVKFVPWQERSAFYGLMEKSCVYLDTIGFSGFNTAMQAIECSLPVVSREGSYLRGRLASGILRKMGMDELIANSDEEYVLLVCELVNNPEYRGEIQKKITSNRKKIFNDQLPVHSLEKFIEKTVNSICK